MMNCRHSLVTENEFFQATGLDSRSRRKFEELGFLKPIGIVGDEAFYSPEDLEMVLIMKKYVGGAQLERRIRESDSRDEFSGFTSRLKGKVDSNSKLPMRAVMRLLKSSSDSPFCNE